MGALAGGTAADVIGWRGWLSLVAVLPAVAVALVMIAIPVDEPDAPDATLKAGRSGLRPLLTLAAAFGCIGLIGVAVIALLPTFLVATRGTPIATAGAATALVSVASVPGSLLAGWLMRRGAGLRGLGLCSLLMPIAALGAFVIQDSVAGGVAATALILFANGIVVSAMFAAVPRLARSPARIALGNGLVAQLGSLGTLVGPPLFGATIAGFGWQAIPVLILAFSLLGMALAAAAEADHVGTR
jgi:predicted MFS family arabinose efflux permease